MGDHPLVRIALHPPMEGPFQLGCTLAGTLDFRQSQEAAAQSPATPKCVQVSPILRLPCFLGGGGGRTPNSLGRRNVNRPCFLFLIFLFVNMELITCSCRPAGCDHARDGGMDQSKVSLCQPQRRESCSHPKGNPPPSPPPPMLMTLVRWQLSPKSHRDPFPKVLYQEPRDPCPETLIWRPLFESPHSETQNSDILAQRPKFHVRFSPQKRYPGTHP